MTALGQLGAMKYSEIARRWAANEVRKSGKEYESEGEARDGSGRIVRMRTDADDLLSYRTVIARKLDFKVNGKTAVWLNRRDYGNVTHGQQADVKQAFKADGNWYIVYGWGPDRELDPTKYIPENAAEAKQWNKLYEMNVDEKIAKQFYFDRWPGFRAAVLALGRKYKLNEKFDYDEVEKRVGSWDATIAARKVWEKEDQKRRREFENDVADLMSKAALPQSRRKAKEQLTFMELRYERARDLLAAFRGPSTLWQSTVIGAKDDVVMAMEACWDVATAAGRYLGTGSGISRVTRDAVIGATAAAVTKAAEDYAFGPIEAQKYVAKLQATYKQMTATGLELAKELIGWHIPASRDVQHQEMAKDAVETLSESERRVAMLDIPGCHHLWDNRHGMRSNSSDQQLPDFTGFRFKTAWRDLTGGHTILEFERWYDCGDAVGERCTFYAARTTGVDKGLVRKLFYSLPKNEVRDQYGILVEVIPPRSGRRSIELDTPSAIEESRREAAEERAQKAANRREVAEVIKRLTGLRVCVTNEGNAALFHTIPQWQESQRTTRSGDPRTAHYRARKLTKGTCGTITHVATTNSSLLHVAVTLDAPLTDLDPPTQLPPGVRDQLRILSVTWFPSERGAQIVARGVMNRPECKYCNEELTDGSAESGYKDGPDWCVDGDFGCGKHPDSSAEGVASHETWNVVIGGTPAGVKLFPRKRAPTESRGTRTIELDGLRAILRKPLWEF